MIDYDMYRYAHPQNPIFADPPGDEFHLGVGETAGETPLESDLLITLPSVIAGFGMKDKTWGKSKIVQSVLVFSLLKSRDSGSRREPDFTGHMEQGHAGRSGNEAHEQRAPDSLDLARR